MRLLLDQGLPRSAARLLREAGVDTVHVGEIGYSDADDASILKRARDEERTVVTFDADFHALLALSRATSPSVIRIRIEGLCGQRAADLFRPGDIYHVDNSVDFGVKRKLEIRKGVSVGSPERA